MNSATYIIIGKMEEKLRELMGDEAYMEFAKETAKEAFRNEVEGMADCEFKDFVIENLQQIIQ